MEAVQFNRETNKYFIPTVNLYFNCELSGISISAAGQGKIDSFSKQIDTTDERTKELNQKEREDQK